MEELQAQLDAKQRALAAANTQLSEMQNAAAPTSAASQEGFVAEPGTARCLHRKPSATPEADRRRSVQLPGPSTLPRPMSDVGCGAGEDGDRLDLGTPPADHAAHPIHPGQSLAALHGPARVQPAESQRTFHI